MPPKEKVESSEQVLQAVILADSFDERFQPITLETARVNAPSLPLLQSFMSDRGKVDTRKMLGTNFSYSFWQTK